MPRYHHVACAERCCAEIASEIADAGIRKRRAHPAVAGHDRHGAVPRASRCDRRLKRREALRRGDRHVARREEDVRRTVSSEVQQRLGENVSERGIEVADQIDDDRDASRPCWGNRFNRQHGRSMAFRSETGLRKREKKSSQEFLRGR